MADYNPGNLASQTSFIKILALLTGSTDSSVSWQSVFWAVIAALLNVLLQNSGAVCGTPAAYRVCLRSSPAVCAVDTGMCLFEFTWMTRLGYSPRTAARHVWYDRFDESDTRESSGIDSIWRLNMVAFILGALPQVVKILAMQGVPLTQSFAVVFLAAFVVLEILRIVAGVAYERDLPPMPGLQRAKDQLRKIRRLSFQASVAIQALVWIWMISTTLPSTWFVKTEDGGPGPLTNAAITIAIVSISTILLAILFFLSFLIGGGMVLGLLALIDFLSGRISRRLGGPAHPGDALADFVSRVFAADPSLVTTACHISLYFTAFITASILFLYLCSFLPVIEVPGAVTEKSTIKVLEYVARFAAAAFLLLISLSLFHVIYRVCYMGAYSRNLKRFFGLHGSLKEFCSILFLTFNVFTLYVYYSSVYDSKGTYRPKWIDMLG